MQKLFLFLIFPLFFSLYAEPKVKLGVDVFFEKALFKKFSNKKIGLITNHTGVDSHFRTTVDLFLEQKEDLSISAIFCPEHGLEGFAFANEQVNSYQKENLTIYSLFSESRRPTEKMLKEIDVLIYDIQEIGSRTYTYATTLFYVMEAAAEHKIPVVVLDRPNPLGGDLIDGPMLQDVLRSFVGYVNVPYCHGMTIGELALFFNSEYSVNCDLQVIPMQGWKRSMTYMDTGLQWIPTSPYIPEPDTPFYYASTGILGELRLVNIGVGYTLPFKVIGAPWIKSKEFADILNQQNLPGVQFVPFTFRPFYGLYKGEVCQGVKIIITSYSDYKPLSVQYLLLGILKSLYPKEFAKRVKDLSPEKIKIFAQLNGNSEFFDWLKNEKYVAWKFLQFQKEERATFLSKREKYLLYSN